MAEMLPPTFVRLNDGYILYKDNGKTCFYKRYVHSPLRSSRSIRLLRMRCHDGQTDLANGHLLQHFDIEEHNLDQVKGQYVALSYTWGSSDLNAPITLKSKVEREIHLTTSNAWEAITRLRPSCLLWVDQVCIDQGNHTEVDQQIRLMPEIYTNCEKCCIWLGPQDTDTETAFAFIHLLNILIPIREAFPFDYSQFISKSPSQIRDMLSEYYKRDLLPPAEDPGWVAFGRCLCKPWFQRVWTFQEALLPHMDAISVHCGRFSVPFKAFDRAAILVGNRNDLGESHDKARTALYQISRMQFRLRNKMPRSMFSLLNASSGRECREPRDKIYGLIGLQMEERPMEPIEVDTTRSDVEVYIDSVRKMIISEGSLLVCTTASERLGGRVHGLPSWVPDWTARQFATLIESIDRTQPTFFSADRGRKLFNISGEISHTLKARGQIVDTINFIIPNDVWEISPVEEITARLRNLVPQLLASLKARSDETEMALLARIARTIVCGSTMRRFQFREFNLTEGAIDLDTFARVFATPQESIANIINRNLEANEVGRWVNGFSEQAALCNYQRFALLEKRRNFLGLVPRRTAPGDRVVILHGMSIPIVLRSGECDTFRLIGSCFVDGMMYGEATTWEENDSHLFHIV